MTDPVRTTMMDLLRSRDICVLATTSGNRPHCSLMAYVTDEVCGEIYMVTGRDTTKYRNLTANPEVSLLIDTREDYPEGGRGRARALTVDGRCEPVLEAGKRERVADALRSRHPHLQTILDGPGAEILCVTVRSLLLLKGVSEAHFVTVE